MKEYKINNYMLDIDEAWGDADYYHANEVTVVIYKRRQDGQPYRILIEEKEKEDV